ncbi:ras-associating and dilute domain-containing protein isoform X1 [Myxocyprinus asiaticus]|uniref:ras-associating and dilute domain-containing protein isoform X1 n=1 Tax=Myxocyprinus asiaticus TaxID=70543 RepID=UPI0022212FDC|nr:ras-associating and dilute domain-containing protein isoform X1 [Myxocyprinus asiaticus]
MIANEGSSQTSKPPPASPAGLPVSASKRRISRVGRKQSNGSVQSSSSSGTTRSAESVGIRQPAKNKIRRHQHRLSAVFGRGSRRGSGEMAASGEEMVVTEDPSELSNHITAPGILKIFGTEICEGANYKSVLATTHSCAKELVKEALARYSLSKEHADDYVLCDVIGCIGDHPWRTECVRVVGDNEKPLLLQSLWKPREGYARRFEIQHKASVEENISKDRDTVTAGINAQARKLQKTRSRGKSVPLDLGISDGAVDSRHNLFRSLSEMNLPAEAQSTCGHSCTEVHKNCKNQSQGEEPEAEAYKATHCHANEREETESSNDNTTQYSIHPPLEFPYFLLLHGFSYRQDFIIYALIGSKTVFGRQIEQTCTETEGDTENLHLWAPDILQQHCCVQRLDIHPAPDQTPGRVTLLKPLNRAKMKRNGVTITQEVELQSGDIISLGEHYLFMYKDPTSPVVTTPPTVTLPWQAEMSHTCKLPPLCKTCVLSERERKYNGLPCFRDSDGAELVLAYDVEHETRILKEIFATIDQNENAHKLTASFLLCLCLQQSATHFSMPALRRLLLQIANGVQIVVWEKAKELAALQPEIDSDPEDLPPNTDKLFQALEPLVLWMANSIQLLHFIQQEVPRLLHGISQEEEDEEEDCIAVLQLRLSSVRSASEEAMTVLEEVIMFTFQQCVYYLTKMLYPVLPGLLDSNPFSESGHLHISEDVKGVLDICTKTLQLVRVLHVHPEITLQLFAYLFFFINALLFNLLMERGSGGMFYHWSCGVRIRANLDLLMDWAHGAGMSDLAHSYLLKLSSAVNLLATPKENLLQMSWSTLRMEFTSLNPAQLHHILREYNPRRSCPAAWTPSSDEASAALRTIDILEGFDNHPPLFLPTDGFELELKRPVSETGLIKQLSRFQRLIKNLTDTESNPHSPEPPQLVSAVPMEAKLTKMEVHPKAQLEIGHTEIVFPHAGTSDLGSCEALITKKLQNLELQNNRVNHSSVERLTLDPSCLLTPPNTPQNLELMDSETDHQEADQTSKYLGAIKQDEGKSEEHEIGEEDVFVLELQRGACGLGLELVDGEETPFKVSGIYIKTVIPDSPAALSQRLRAGDRILALNGLSLVGVDFQIGKELFQMSGERTRLLVARFDSTTKETRTNLPA